MKVERTLRQQLPRLCQFLDGKEVARLLALAQEIDRETYVKFCRGVGVVPVTHKGVTKYHLLLHLVFPEIDE